MKFIIFNYSSPILTQPFYFNKEINNIDSCECLLVSGTDKLYYLYDTFKPDFGIINIGDNLTSIVHYNQNSERKVKHLINIDYISQSQVEEVKKVIKYADGLECKMLFSSNFKHRNIDFGVPYLHIANCTTSEELSEDRTFEIDSAIVISKEKDKKEYKGTHHFLTIGKSEAKADSSPNTLSVFKIFQNYNNVIFRNLDPENIPEAFFNAALTVKNGVYFDNDSKEDSKVLNDSLQKMFDVKTSFDYSDNDDQDILTIREKISKKHTPRRRLKQMLSNISEARSIVMSMGARDE
jgi:hypothetical protein